jgi:hypothetical protein
VFNFRTEALRSSETPEDLYQDARCHIPEWSWSPLRELQISYISCVLIKTVMVTEQLSATDLEVFH